MKPINFAISTGLDRASTRSEFFDALSLMSQGSFEPVRRRGDFREIDFAISGRASDRPEEGVLLVSSSDMADSSIN